jgi:uncharacterized protein (DUF1800 family)
VGWKQNWSNEMIQINKNLGRPGQAKRKATGLFVSSPSNTQSTRFGLSTTTPDRGASLSSIAHFIPIMPTFKSTMLLRHTVILIALFIFPSFLLNPKSESPFPYQQAGLTDRQAAAHLLSRFTFGAKPDEVDQVVKIGLEKWFQQQLKSGMADAELKERLSSYDALGLSNQEVLAQFPRGPEVRKMAIHDGFISKDSVGTADKKELKAQYEAYRKQKGFRDDKELFRQFISQKILRAAYSQNQLHEVLTDFWFNHFNVSISKNQCAQFIPAYERDVIRPRVVATFEELLITTAKSPAMLMYLDNASSMGVNEELADMGNEKKMNRRPGRNTRVNPKQKNKVNKNKKAQGLNENYAREVMELHTLGVDGGYTQADVTEAARVLTGWTIYPLKEDGAQANIRKKLDQIGESNLKRKGFLHEGDFLFAMNRHDIKEKNVLGKKFKAGGGYQDGVELLKMLAHHPSTAKFISKKIAVRFVGDSPSQNLIDAMTKTFIEKNGAIDQVLLTMVSSPEFWNTKAQRAKTKSPFEYAISSVRALDADVQLPFQLNQWITRMGQKLYFYAAPTGFPDRGQYWINTGSLLNRMNFGLAIAAKRIPGIQFDLAALNNHHEPESAAAALPIYAQLMLPERNVEPTIQRLTPLVSSPDINKNVEQAASKEKVVSEEEEMNPSMTEEKTKGKKKNEIQQSFGDHTMLAQVVGIIIGSPEFQRR